jgi:hypothetical protein
MHLALEVIPSLGSTDSERFRQDWPEISQMDGTNFPVGGHGHRLVLKRIERKKNAATKQVYGTFWSSRQIKRVSNKTRPLFIHRVLHGHVFSFNAAPNLLLSPVSV